MLPCREIQTSGSLLFRYVTNSGVESTDQSEEPGKREVSWCRLQTDVVTDK